MIYTYEPDTTVRPSIALLGMSWSSMTEDQQLEGQELMARLWSGDPYSENPVVKPLWFGDGPCPWENRNRTADEIRNGIL